LSGESIGFQKVLIGLQRARLEVASDLFGVETGFQNHFSLSQPNSLDLSSGMTGLVRSVGLVWLRLASRAVHKTCPVDSPDKSGEKLPNGSFWGGGYK
jgi:hypothetical protein